MTAALEGGEWSAARPGRTLPSGKTRYPFYRRLGGPQGRSGRAENVPTGILSGTVQPGSSVAIPTELPGPHTHTQYSSPSISIQSVYKLLPKKKSLSLSRTGHFSRHPFPAVVRFRTSSSALDLTNILELSAQKQQRRSLSHSSRSFFFVKFPFLGVNYLSQLNVKEFLGTIL